MAWLHAHDGPEGRSWHVRWRDAEGRRHSRSLGAVSDAAAEAERVRIEVVEERRAPRLADLPPAEAVERWLLSLSVQRRSQETVDFCRRRLAPLAEAWAAVPLRAWSRPMLEAYLAGKPSWGPRTVQMLVRAVGTFRRWCLASGVACGDVVGGLRAPTVRRSERLAWTAEELRRILAAAAGDPLSVPVHLAMLAGLSYGDLRALTWAEVDLAGGWIVRPRSKTGAPLRLPIEGRLRAVLEAEPRLPGPVCRSWPPSRRGAYDALYRLLDAAEVERGGWHRLRHSYATLLGASGVDAATVARLLGHRPGSAVTMLYLHSDDARLRRAAEAVERALG